MKRYFMPLVVALVGGFLVHTTDAYLNYSWADSVVTILRIATLFAFGLSLHDRGKGRDQSWVKKLVISFVLFYFVAWELGYRIFPSVKYVLNQVGIYGFVLYLIYVYLGYSFFD